MTLSRALALILVASCGGTVAAAPPATLFLTLLVQGGPGSVSGLTTGPCNGVCTTGFAAGTEVTLVEGQGRFLNWDGACAGSSTTCTLILKASTSVTANFAPEVSVTLKTTSGFFAPGETGHFIATVANADDPTVDWSIAEGSAGGFIDATGLYTAPGAAGQFHVIATSHFDPSKSATAPIEVEAAGTQSIGYQLGVDHAGQMSFPAPMVFPTAPAWTASFKGSVTSSYPIVAAGKVFVTVLESVDPNRLSTSLYALDAQTGAVVWGPFVDFNDLGNSNAAYDRGQLFVVDSVGVLTRLDAATGAVGFQVLLPDEFIVFGPPVASGGAVYVNGAVDFGGNLSAISETDGSVLWTMPVVNGDDGAPALSGTSVFVSYPGQYYAFDRRTGGLLWHFAGDTEGGGGETSVYREGRLYVRDPAGRSQAASPGVVLDDTIGATLATFDSAPPPAVGHQRAVFVSAGVARCFDPATGDPFWTFSLPRDQVVSAPVEINGVVFVGSNEGSVYALDGATGTVVWSGGTGVFTTPGLFGAGEGLLVVPADNVLTAWRLQ